ncbi:MAG: hypothetical protein VB835_10705 [Pirellulales bacterium]
MKFRHLAVLSLLATGIAGSVSGQPNDPKPGGRGKHPAPGILVVPDGWGQAAPPTVKRVLESTAIEIWQHFPDRKLSPIIVSAKGGPIVLYDKSPSGEYIVRLNTGDLYWSQYAYQFAHEFCHILCNYDQDKSGNKWFEESVCEMASLFALRRMGETWKTAPPFGHWKGYAKHLTAYAEDRMSKARLPQDRTLAIWYERHAVELNGTAVNRELNNVVAMALLTLFEAEPQHWPAVGFLNHGTPEKPQTFAEYLTDWRGHCPQRHRKFVNRIATEFGVELDES